MAKTLTKPAAATAPAAAPTSGGLVLRRKRGPVPEGTPRPILVELPGGPMVVVTATDNEDAWAKFKAVCGIKTTDQKPKFSRPGDDVSVNDAGVVVDKNGLPALASLKKPGRELTEFEEEEIDG